MFLVLGVLAVALVAAFGVKTRFLVDISALAWLAGALQAQTIVVDTSKAINSFSPPRAFGGAIDRLRDGATKEDNEKNTERLLTDPVLKEMLGAGWGTVTYRQNTELMIEAWHWNRSEERRVGKEWR